MDTDERAECTEKLTGLHISSLDDDNDEEEQPEQPVIIGEDDDDDDDDDEDEEEEEPVTLGFVEKPKNSWSLLRQLFPSKAGGVPAWLDPVNLPSGRSCLCDMCGEPLQFLLQVYAPVTEKESTFHRALFVFMCNSMTCLLRDQHEQWKRGTEMRSRSVKVFRCQLPRTNPFYSSEPPKNDGTDKPSGSGVALCSWCGTWKGDKQCGRCKRVRYCSQKHQAMHWNAGHKTICLSLSSQLPNCGSSSSCGTTTGEMKVASKTLWPEYEMINEDESEFDSDMSDDNSTSAALISKSNIDDRLLQRFEGDSDKRCWASFLGRISKAQDQVLRYCRSMSAKPLWPMSGGRPSKSDIPSCSYCGGPLSFEFQILPQLLYYFGVKNDEASLDWATIMVYTCTASCEATVGYKEEFAWVQLFSPSAAA